MSTRNPRLVALATAVPPNVVLQTDVKRFAAELFSETIGSQERLLDIFDNAQIDERRMCAPIEWHERDRTFAEKNDLFIQHARQLGTEVARGVLDRAGLSPHGVDHLIFVSSTGLATPGIDAMIANDLELREDVRRTPVWGLGCAGGAAGLARARDFALADPSARIMLVALELCSLTFQKGDLSKRNLVAASLFGDGAAAALVAGSRVGDFTSRHLPLELVASRSTLWPDTLDVMGWTVDEDGLHVVFSRDIPAIVREEVRPGLVSFLATRGLSLDDVAHIVAHPGGAKVLRAYADALALPPGRLTHAREVLRRYGNMSSPSCLFVLERFQDSADIRAGEYAVIAALGPGFSAEYVLVRGASR